jgi:hypothetical protein
MRRLEPTAIQLNQVMKVNALLQQVKTQVPSKYGKRKEKKRRKKKRGTLVYCRWPSNLLGLDL